MKKILIMLTLSVLFVALNAERINLNSRETGAELISSDIDETIVEFNLGSFERMPVEINGETYYQINAKTDGKLYLKGQPGLPEFAKALIIPNNAKMQVEIIDSEYKDYQMAVAPSKGKIMRNVNPDTVPYVFGNSYQNDGFFPENQANLAKPYILRDYRGTVLHLVPFAYDNSSKTLRVYTKMTVKVYADGIDTENVLERQTKSQTRFFDGLYSRFINFEAVSSRYTQLGEHGRMIVICYPDFMDAMQPYVEWKNQKGIKTDMYNVNDIGTNASAVKNFIQEEYDENNGLVFVQLIGDAAQIPTFTSGGGGSDPKYALLAGTDSYPDIFVGRFSAENVAQVETQVERTVYYERDIEEGDWLTKGVGIASAQGAGQGDDGEADWQHQDVIRNVLLNYTYNEIDQIYDTNGGTSAAVAVALNEGRGIINYTGHGSNTSWGTTGFSNNNINQLTNDNELPFINSVACVNGNFTGSTCFAEAWLRATNNSTGAPTGAIAFFGSTINQSWQPPMSAQDDAIELLAGAGAYAGQGNQKNTIGGLWYNSTMEMLDTYNAVDMYETWHIFGDVSLQVRTDNPQEFSLTHNPAIFIGLTEFSVNAGVENALVCLSDANKNILGSGYTDASGDITLALENVPNIPSDLNLTVTGYNFKTSTSVISLLPNEGPYVMGMEMEPNMDLSYGNTVKLDLHAKNLGSQTASGVEVELVIDDMYITLNDNQETAGDIEADQEINLEEAFEIVIADNIPDDHQIACTLNFSDADENSWSNVINLTSVAPAFEFIDYTVDDSNGNNNGVMDAGETVNLNVTLKNTGHAPAPAGNVVISSTSPYVTINTAESETAEIPADGQIGLSFEIMIADNCPTGEGAAFLLTYTAGAYTAVSPFITSLGLQIEDFENSFDNYEWEFEGGNWTIDSENHEGSSSAKSATINDNQATSMKITMDVTAESEISFWKKVSSENNYDFLRFYIDNVEKGSWSGDVAWSESIYEVEPGEHTFKWEYSKDVSFGSGQDCAWVDYIIFPSAGSANPEFPVINVNPVNIEFIGEVLGEEISHPITFSNLGTSELNLSFELPENFSSDYERNGKRDAVNITIPAGGDPVQVMIILNPMESMDYSASFHVMSNDMNNPDIEVQLNADFTNVDNDNTQVYTTEFKGNYPNPFNPTTTISFSVEKASDVEINIYNVKGQKVKSLLNQKMDAGNHQIQWHGKDDNGKQAGSGIYFMKLNAKDVNLSAMKKMILMK
ncbi:MAG: gingipain R [Candidatus Cloacimonadota bacterium]|nr:MAG: gingipain R [Candidatus Cloacimonadota bacterium]